MESWTGKRVVIIGAARQGLALARYLASQGAQVVLNDRRTAAELQPAIDGLGDLQTPVEWVVGEHPTSVIEDADLVCPSGGVPLDLPLVVEARRRDIPLSNDSQIFLDHAPCPVIGITGSAGKTTTTTLVGRMAEAATRLPLERAMGRKPRKVWVGGNIGSPLISSLDQVQGDDLAVMELSSFQLEIMTTSPYLAAVLNVTPNHLDRHASMEDYTAAKAHILDYQHPGNIAVLGRDDPGAWALRSRLQGRLLSFGINEPEPNEDGTFIKGERLMLRLAGRDQMLMPRNLIQLRGEHNLLNVLAASAITAAAGLELKSIWEGVDEFTGVPHRLELVREWKGVSWYNDSIATAPERAMAAIRSFDEPIILLAGGKDKNLPWEDFAKLVQERVDHIILFGQAADVIEKALRAAGAEDLIAGYCSGLEEAVRIAADLVIPGDVVLLSPGGTSFDEFRDFESRGEAYRQWVMSLV